MKSYDEAVERRLSEAKAELKSFAAKGPQSEQKERAIVRDGSGCGRRTVCEVVLAELANADRFRFDQASDGVRGPSPAKRESDGKKKGTLGITKQGSRLLRWAMWSRRRGRRFRTSAVAGWSPRATEASSWFQASDHRWWLGARRLLGVLTSILQSGEVPLFVGGTEGSRKGEEPRRESISVVWLGKPRPS